MSRKTIEIRATTIADLRAFLRATSKCDPREVLGVRVGGAGRLLDALTKDVKAARLSRASRQGER